MSFLGNRSRIDDPSADRVVEIVVDVRHDVADADDLPLQRHGHQVGVVRDDVPLPLRVLEDAVPHFDGEVQPLPVALQLLDHPDRLLDVVEAVRHQLGEHLFAGVPERRVAEIVAHDDRLGERFVEAERAGHRAGDLRHLQRMRDARAVVIPFGGEKALRLAGPPPERGGRGLPSSPTWTRG